MTHEKIKMLLATISTILNAGLVFYIMLVGTPEPTVIIEEKEVVKYIETVPIAPAATTNVVNFQPINPNYDVFKPSYLTSADLLRMLGQGRSGLHSLVDSFVEAEKTYGVNSLYLISTIGYESMWGKYETGENNIAGWKGNKGRWSDFDSRHECIMTVAKHLANDFKVNTGSTVESVSKRYCPDEGYTETLMTIMNELKVRY